jgi:hypothetical protein
MFLIFGAIFTPLVYLLAPSTTLALPSQDLNRSDNAVLRLDSNGKRVGTADGHINAPGRQLQASEWSASTPVETWPGLDFDTFGKFIRSIVELVKDLISPVADAGGPYVVNEGNEVSLDGSLSSDPDNNIVSYEWDIDYDGEFDDATGATVSFTPSTAGIFTIRLKVTDAYGLQDIDATTLTIDRTESEMLGPYLSSDLIVNTEFDWSTHIRKAIGSDNWPITWSGDDHQYTAWGDGGGFGGTNDKGRVSLGFARVEGGYDNYRGFNVWGGKNGKNPARFEGKSNGIISIDGVLYAWVSPGSSVDGYEEARMYRSEEHAATWTPANWKFERADGLAFPTILNFGKDYEGSRDDYVYHYFIELQDPTQSVSLSEWNSLERHNSIALARSHKINVQASKSSYKFFAGMDKSGQPFWTSNISLRQPVFSDPNGVGFNVSVSYNSGLRRYILATEHGEGFKGNLGLFEAPEPWGPWKTITYLNNSEGNQFGSGVIDSDTFFWNFSNKWLSADGKDFTLIFSGFGGGRGNDSWNTVRGSFDTAVGGLLPVHAQTSDALLGHWQFDDTSGTIPMDSTGNRQ